MPKSGEPCAQAKGHSGRCRTASATKAGNTRTTSYNRGRVADRQKLVNAYKTARGCLTCGYDDDPVGLDLDHLDPVAKRADVSKLIWYASWEAVLAELEKCQVLCAVCHRVKTVRGTAYLLAHARRKPVTGTADDGLSS